MIKYKSSMFTSRDVCIHFERKRGAIYALLILPIQVNTRHLNEECFELAVPTIFQSYAPTVFMILKTVISK